LIIKILYIAFGGAIGSVLRFGISNFFKFYCPFFPLGTFFINITGSFFIGLLIGYLNNKGVAEFLIRYFLIIGVLGSFTTFSAFSIDAIELFKQDRMYLSFFYIIISVFFSIFAACFGFIVIKL